LGKHRVKKRGKSTGKESSAEVRKKRGDRESWAENPGPTGCRNFLLRGAGGATGHITGERGLSATSSLPLKVLWG